MRLALIGCGAIATRTHLPAFRAIEGVDVVAFASRSRSSAEAAAELWGSGVVTDDWRQALEVEGVDAVDICAPNAQHAEIALAAMERGLHVLVEKPMATTVAEADAMVAAAAANDVVLMPAQNLRFAPPFVAAAEAVATGRVGNVVGFRAAFGHGGPETWAPDATWFFDRDSAGGGALLDLGIHMIDVLHAVCGGPMTEVAAMVDTPHDGSAVERVAQLVLRTGGGALGTLHASWSAKPAPDHQLTIFGTDARLHLDGRTPLTLSGASGGHERVEAAAPTDSPYAAFARAVAGERPAVIDGSDGRAAVAVACAAYEAARSGRTVTVQP